jgi:hypothetical protein
MFLGVTVGCILSGQEFAAAHEGDVVFHGPVAICGHGEGPCLAVLPLFLQSRLEELGALDVIGIDE